MTLKTLSKYEIKNKLLSKGIKSDLIDEYFQNNQEELDNYELNSCKKLIKKNINSKDEKKLIDYLFRKGYSQDIIKLAIETVE
jgi:SOS response regulatory protein OraA/RecX